MAETVITRAGRLEGETQREVHAFRGVRFAEPPVGPLRFQAPEAESTWSGVRHATSAGPSAPQIGPVNRFIRLMIGAAGSRQSQDCLFLNVWSPGLDDAKRPVMVWIHGGAFILGSGSTRLYAGARLAERGDVVVVTINYRLGALGFLSWSELCEDADCPPANVGLRDQLAALEWVRDNIAQFGGDPSNVTVFGESAGAMSIGTLLGTPAARGLFHKAILQSGAAHNVSSAAQAGRVAREYAAAVGVSGPARKDLESRSVTELMRAQAQTTARIGLSDGVMAWQPCVDGDLVPEQPLDAIARGLSADVPVMIGTNRDEWKLFMATDRIRLDDATLDERVRRVARRLDEEGDDIASLASRAYARVQGRRGDDPSERWSAFQTDRLFHHPAVALADRQSDHQPDTYAYLFEWAPPVIGRWLGACHALELPFVFGGLRAALLRAGLAATPTALRLCDAMQDAWIAFAHTGAPGHSGLPEWPRYSRDARFTMALGEECTLREDPHRRAREFWEPIHHGGNWRWE